MKSSEFKIGKMLGLIGVSFIAGCATSNEPSDTQPNILWINLDDARADVLGCYDAPWAVTPNIDRLAEEGVRFHHAIVQNPVCVPSRNSMKTGYYAYEVGPVEMGRLPDIQGSYIDQERMEALNNAPVLLDAWTAIGMQPINIGKVHAKRDRFNHLGDIPRLIKVKGEPFPYYEENVERDGEMWLSDVVTTDTHQWVIGGILNVKPEETETWRIGDKAVDVLDDLNDNQEPFFLRVSFYAPHVACYVPEEYFIDPSTIDLPLPTEEELAMKPEFEKGPLRMYAGADLTREQIDLARGTYYGMVALVDVQVGRILQALEDHGMLENTIIAFTSDQGFQLGERGLWKKRVFYEENVRTPFLIRYPKKLPKNKTIEEPVELVDFLPTLMELSGLEVPREIRGRSLTPLIHGEVTSWREATFSEIDHSQSIYQELREGSGRRVMVRTKEWKLIFFMDDRVEDKDGALYHLATDPGEKVNLYNDPQYGQVINDLEVLAKRWDSGENLFVEK